MIFQHTLPWVLEVSPHTGKPKTSTLRVAKQNQRFTLVNRPGLIEFAALAPWEIEEFVTTHISIQTVYNYPAQGRRTRIYAVNQVKAAQPGRGQIAQGIIKITRIKMAIPSRLTDVEIRAEGFGSRDQFEETWQVIHGRNKLEVPCWLNRFEKVGV